MTLRRWEHRARLESAGTLRWVLLDDSALFRFTRSEAGSD